MRKASGGSSRGERTRAAKPGVRRATTKAAPQNRAAPTKNATRGERYAAFLRGINIGGRTLPMPALAAMFERAGCTDVNTYIQSGNVVFTKTGSIDGVAEAVERSIQKSYGFEAPVVVRSAKELGALLTDAPFPDPGGEKPALHVLFLAHEPAPAAVKALDPNRSPGDSFLVRGKHVYLLCPNGLADTKLSNAYFDSKLRTTSTGRNFRTIRKLLDLCEA